ncbi:MAG: hypothetical protein FWC12_05885 [Treponema sp.]|nr:hypothetical protein [Treponema sp.]
MRNNKFLLIFLLIFIISSCKTIPDTVQDTPDDNTQPQTQSAESDVFDPAKVSQDYYTSTKDEVQQFIEKLNQIIRTRNYNAWTETLSQEYIDLYSSPVKLKEISEEPTMKRANIVLRNLNDYFTRVFVPARNPDRVQINNIDIEFVTVNRVRAFITRINNAGEETREILYNLEKINNSWKIIN